MCGICYNDSVRHLLKTFVLPCDPTTRPQRHMELHGFDRKGERLRLKKRKERDIEDAIDAQNVAQSTVFNLQGWKRAFV